jgi:hypothetical protein
MRRSADSGFGKDAKRYEPLVGARLRVVQRTNG